MVVVDDDNVDEYCSMPYITFSDDSTGYAVHVPLLSE